MANTVIGRVVATEKNPTTIALNKFKSDDISCNDKEILEVLSYYTITRDEAEA